jgi:hypothetical protein
MNTLALLLARAARPSLLLLALALATLTGATAQPAVRAADPSPQPVAAPSAGPLDAPGMMCESLADLRLYIGFLQDQSLSEDGLVPVLVGVVASLSEAQTLAGLVQETYRPLVDDLVTSLTDLEASVRHLLDQETLGAGLVQLGEAISGVGTNLDALSAAVGEPCPVASVPSPAPGSPAASAPPAA